MISAKLRIGSFERRISATDRISIDVFVRDRDHGFGPRGLGLLDTVAGRELAWFAVLNWGVWRCTGEPFCSGYVETSSLIL